MYRCMHDRYRPKVLFLIKIDKKYSSGTGCCVAERPGGGGGGISSNLVPLVILWFLSQQKSSGTHILTGVRLYYSPLVVPLVSAAY